MQDVPFEAPTAAALNLAISWDWPDGFSLRLTYRDWNGFGWHTVEMTGAGRDEVESAAATLLDWALAPSAVSPPVLLMLVGASERLGYRPPDPQR